MPKKKSTVGKPQINKELSGYEIKVNTFGEIESSFNIDDINSFLNENVADKKLKDRDGFKEITTEEETEE